MISKSIRNKFDPNNLTAFTSFKNISHLKATLNPHFSSKNIIKSNKLLEIYYKLMKFLMRAYNENITKIIKVKGFDQSIFAKKSFFQDVTKQVKQLVVKFESEVKEMKKSEEQGFGQQMEIEEISLTLNLLQSIKPFY